jgi:hypothetical protein
MLKKIPKRILAKLSSQEKSEAEDWWHSLDYENKAELTKSYLIEKVKQQEPHTLTFYGKFVEGNEPYGKDEFWVLELYEYLVNHEIYIQELQLHVGGVCTSQKAAQKSTQKGFIDANFSCPLGKTDCRMREPLKYGEGKSLKLFIKVSEIIDK